MGTAREPDLFIGMMLAQLELQQNAMKRDPLLMAQHLHTEANNSAVSPIYFAWWNSYALEDELHEAMAEVGWKPWAKSNHFNAIRFVEEMVDAWHFFMNMLLVAMPLVEAELEADTSTERVEDRVIGFCHWFEGKYHQKHAKNAKRQEDGYDGVSTKCKYCHRDFEEVEGSESWKEFGVCSQLCFQDAKLYQIDAAKEARKSQT